MDITGTLIDSSSHTRALVRHTPLTWLMPDITGPIITYDELIAGSGVIVSNGGAWNCFGLRNDCTQDGTDANSPITSSIDSSYYVANFMLWANMNFSDSQFNGVASMQFTYGFDAMATWGDPSATPPSPVRTSSYIGPFGSPSSTFQDNVTYDATTWTSIRHTGSIKHQIGLFQVKMNANVWTSNHPASISIKGIFFQMSNFIYSTTSTSSTVGTTSVQGTVSLSSIPGITSFSSSSTSHNLSPLALPSISLANVIPTGGVATTIISHSPDPSASTVSDISSTQSFLNTADTIGIIVGCIVGILGIIVLIVFLLWRRRRINNPAPINEPADLTDAGVTSTPEYEFPADTSTSRWVGMMQQPSKGALPFDQ